MNFVKNKKYYTGTVYEWNLPVGTTCPFALECKVTVDRVTGKFSSSHGAFRCYASAAERFPSPREHRWRNYELAKMSAIPELPADAKHVRIHMSGDFFSQHYFDAWLDYARKHPDVKFWAFTKSIQYWVNRLGDIPSNLILTASYGGKLDHLIEQYKLKSARVVRSVEEAERLGLPLDFNDDYARLPEVSFALLDNYVAGKERQKKNLAV